MRAVEELPIPLPGDENQFSCDEASYLFTSDQQDDYSDLYTIDLSQGKISSNQRFGTSHINATGYNIKDNYIYGFEYGNDNSEDPDNSYHVVRIDSELNIERFNISGLSKTRFYLGDVSMDGIYYLANRDEPNANSNTLQEIQRVNLSTKTLLSKITLEYGEDMDSIVTSDFAFNPKDNKLYMVNSSNNQLIRIDPENSQVEELGYVGDIGDTYSVISFFDVEGNFYFYVNDFERIYKIDISDPSSIDATAIRFKEIKGLINSGDGARCANASISEEEEEEDTLTPSGCLSSALFFQGEQTQLFQLDLITGDMKLLQEENISDGVINAVGYNPKDGFFWGYNNTKQDGTVVQIGLDENGTWQGKEYKISGIEDDFASHVGDIDNEGKLYLYNAKRVLVVDLDPNSNTYLQKTRDFNLSQYVETADWSFNPKDNLFYAVNNGDEETIKYLYKIDPNTGEILSKEDTNLSGEKAFGGSFFDKDGLFYVYDNERGDIFRIDVANSPEALFFSNSIATVRNDGALCTETEFKLDFGDLPVAYPTLLRDNGARHAYPMGEEPSIYLGVSIDSEQDGTVSENATDDLFDDGVSIDNHTFSEAVINAGETITLEVNTTGHAYLNGWIDWNADGDFNDTDEQISKNLTEINGTIQINLNVPSSENNISTYARFRYSSDQDLLPEGVAQDGEVEDYHIFINPSIKKLNGLFNIERTNSGTDPINTQERNAWYTQIVGRDFDYSVLFYTEDMSSEKEIDNVTVKLEIVDQDDNNSVIYQRYAHIKNDPPSSRINVTLPSNDLATLPATQRAIFRISYGIDREGTIIEADCDTDPQRCYERNLLTRTDYAFDNFAIRPETFYISLSDGIQERINSKTSNHSINLASGYEYNLSIIATEYDSIIASSGYNKNFNASFEFNTTGLIACADTSPLRESIYFTEGKHNNEHFKHNNVGHYQLAIPEDENWTNIDHLNGDCILGENSSSLDGNSKSGCNIKLQNNPIELRFLPDHFNVELNLSNLPESYHPDFIYMSELNSTYQRVAIGFQGKITAQNEDNSTASNFTAGCLSTQISVDLNTSTLSVEGSNQRIHTIEGTEVDFSRLIRYNNDPDINHLDYNGTLSHIDKGFIISADTFLDENNGSLILDLRYNLNKNIQEPINPVQVTFQGIEVAAQEANSTAHDKVHVIDTPHTPKGEQYFVNNIKNFYFAQVASDLINYPMVNIHISPIVHTPLNVDIFCDAPNTYCRDTNVTLNSNWNSSERKQDHFYLSIHHNPNLDGNITELNPNIANVTITPDPTPVGAEDITLSSGRNGIITTRFDNCNSPKCIVTIVADPAITFTPKSYYQVNCSNLNPSSWTGAGKRGNAIESQAQVERSGKMEW